MPKKFSLKDHLFNPQKVAKLAAEIKAVYPVFDAMSFQKKIVEKLPDLELKQRITHISKTLEDFLPARFEDALSIILQALPAPCDQALSDDDFGDFIYAPYNEFLARNGATKGRVELSLNALSELTTRFSAEYAIRTFINNFPEESMAYLRKWVTHPHYHVRRLVSEGTRKSLPWAPKINWNAEDALPLLDCLYSDKTRFVTRSVANHLNDVSKTNPDAVIKRLKKWQESNAQTDKEMQFIIKHSLRTLVKKGHQDTLELLGYSQESLPGVKLMINTPFVKIGEALEFDVLMAANVKTNIVMDYIISFKTKNGKLSDKVYKLKTFESVRGISEIKKRHPFKANMSTRTLYPGTHYIQLQMNGQKQAKLAFEII